MSMFGAPGPDQERAEGAGMGTARVLSSTERKDSRDHDASLLAALRRRIEKHPYASMLVAAAIGAGLGSLMSPRSRAATP
jgi:ElaB/YqjD/DUF883 family membrane-anchored ribosome-binding protein